MNNNSQLKLQAGDEPSVVANLYFFFEKLILFYNKINTYQ